MFQSDNGSQTFGNGTACYTCHSQFGAHAQLFVKFDKDGFWAPFANGEQNPKAETGVSYGGLYTSHLRDPSEAASEQSSMFGRDVNDVSQAAIVLASSEAFARCSVKAALKYFLRLDQRQINGIPDTLVEDIARSARAKEPDPSLQTLVIEALSNHQVIESSIQSRKP
jgi:hypothetical protein